jgi:Holliday junction resolvase RusA-like endonuclease
MFAGPVELRVVFSSNRIEVTVTAMSEEMPISKLRGDLDNYVKTLMDGLNGAAWLDDKQVHGVWALKE